MSARTRRPPRAPSLALRPAMRSGTLVFMSTSPTNHPATATPAGQDKRATLRNQIAVALCEHHSCAHLIVPRVGRIEHRTAAEPMPCESCRAAARAVMAAVDLSEGPGPAGSGEVDHG